MLSNIAHPALHLLSSYSTHPLFGSGVIEELNDAKSRLDAALYQLAGRLAAR